MSDLYLILVQGGERQGRRTDMRSLQVSTEVQTVRGEGDASACIMRHQAFVLAPATVRRVAAAEATCLTKTSRPRENLCNNRENKEKGSQKVDGPRDERGHKR